MGQAPVASSQVNEAQNSGSEPGPAAQPRPDTNVESQPGVDGGLVIATSGHQCVPAEATDSATNPPRKRMFPQVRTGIEVESG